MAEKKTENVEQAAAAVAPEAAQAAAEVEPDVAPKKPRAKAKKATVKAPLTPAERHDARVVERRKKAAARRTGRAQAREKAKGRAHQASVTPPREHVEGTQKTRQGIVVSDKASKSITVRIDVARRHRRYSKIVRTSQTLHAHDEQSDAHIGDTVVIRECRPMSRLKRWRLVEVVARAK
jgi:small subunit ribosomal protein S17